MLIDILSRALAHPTVQEFLEGDVEEEAPEDL
jgi:hypothetical protein